MFASKIKSTDQLRLAQTAAGSHGSRCRVVDAGQVCTSLTRFCVRSESRGAQMCLRDRVGLLSFVVPGHLMYGFGRGASNPTDWES